MCPPSIKTLAPMVDSYGGSAEIYENGHNTLYAAYHQDLLEQMQKHDWQEKAQQSKLQPIPLSSSPEFSSSFVSSGIFPNVNIPFQPTAIPLQTFWPIATNKSRMDITWMGIDWDGDSIPDE